MLIDATHPEETRVVVVSGKRLEEFDFETTSKKQLKGNIYLAKVTRVEPSLQAAFVDYGGNRHGFLAFSEIHPDYYRIPVADREALLAEEAALDAEDSEDFDGDSDDVEVSGREEPDTEDGGDGAEEDGSAQGGSDPDEDDGDRADAAAARATVGRLTGRVESQDPATDAEDEFADGQSAAELSGDGDASVQAEPETPGEPADGIAESPINGATRPKPAAEAKSVETVGGDEIEDVQPRRARNMRRYKIQEVIKRRQIMLVQVTKEERGNKGAALTTYLSLAGRYCVLMPNTARGGGVSRKITNPADRKRLKAVIEELDIPEGMAVIVRTAGSERSKAEIRRDYEYLLRLWDEIRELTLKSTAPALIYEEANLIKRSIRDLYSRDIEDILVEGEDGYRAAKAFMRTLTPSHAKRVQLYKDPVIPLFHRYQVESQLDAIHNPIVQLKSGGYIVINPTEALVAIDVNSGRSTRERNIEETALRTNLEAAEEVARQLRLRDLAGLIVIDFIDMEEPRHNAQVERRLKEAMKTDRARIQLGHISPFGLMELSRQRLRPSLVEASTEMCSHCRGIGYVRSTESTALHVLRSIEEEGIHHRCAAITVTVPTAVALYVLNQKRKALGEVEVRHGLRVFLEGDDTLIPPEFRIERIKAIAPEPGVAHPVSHVSAPLLEAEIEEEEELEEAPAEEAAEAEEERPAGRRRSRRRRRRREDHRPAAEQDEASVAAEAGEAEPAEAAQAAADAGAAGEQPDQETAEAGEHGQRRRRRGRRGGRRRGRRDAEAATMEPAEAGTGAAAAMTPTEAEAPQPEAHGEPLPPSDEAEAASGPEPAEEHWSAPTEVHEEPEVAPVAPPSEPEGEPEAVQTELPMPWEPAQPHAEATGFGGEPAPEREPEPEAPSAPHEEDRVEPAATWPVSTEPTVPVEPREAEGLQPDALHRTEPSEAAGEAAQAPSRTVSEVSYLPERQPESERSRPSAPESAEDESAQDEAAQDTAETPALPRRRGWWRRHAE